MRLFADHTMTGRRAGGRLKQWAHLALLLAAAHCSPPPRTGAPVVASNHVRGPIAMPEERATVEVNAALLRSADPCQDFYRFACGGWLDKVAMPSDYLMWGRGMIEVREFQLRELRRLLSEDPADDSELNKAEDFFRACSKAGDAATAAANLQPFVDLIATVDNTAALMRAVGVLHMIGVPVLFTITTGPDWMNPKVTIVNLDQGGLGLHVPSFYLGTDLVSHTVRDQYRAHLVRMLALVSEPDAAAEEQANTVMAFEHSLAEIFRARDPQLEPQRLYRKAAVPELQELTPHLPWDAYLTEIGHSGSGGFNVAAPEYFSELDRVIAASDFRVVRAYLRWQLIHYTAEMLADAVAAEHFRFHQSILGDGEAEPRWRRCVQSTEQALGDTLARAYFDRHPVGEDERGVHDMIDYVAPAVEAMLSEAAWIDANTRAAGAAKLRGVNLQVGHPSPWPDRDEAPKSSGTTLPRAWRFGGRSLRARSVALVRPSIARAGSLQR
jgi:putative endopeptidase